jgi:hypothetical protein
MHRIDAIVQDEAFYIPLWTTPFLRVAHWDYVRFPETWLPPRTRQFTDHMVTWIDPERRAASSRRCATARRCRRPATSTRTPGASAHAAPVRQRPEHGTDDGTAGNR